MVYLKSCQGPRGNAVRASSWQPGWGVPPSLLPPACKPAAPRLHKTVASTRLCQGRSAGKGLARGGEGRLFSRPCNFPRSRLAGPPRRGVDPDPGPASRDPRAGRRWGVGKRWSNPALFLVFLFHPPVLLSPTSSPVVGEVRRGRGRERREPATSRLTRPVGFGLHRRTTRLWVRGLREGAERE